MTLRFTNILMLFVVWSFTQAAFAQDSTNRNWDAQKIKGVRLLPYASYNGLPFLNNEWWSGKIEFTNGEISDTLYLKYSSFKDELIYYNKVAGAQINIDKASINGFEFIDTDGRTRSFRKQYFDGYLKGTRFFEILSTGETTLLAYRKVDLNTTSAYRDISGKLKNMAYDLNYQFYFYSSEKGYTFVRLSLSGLLSRFDKTQQRPIKKLLRKNRIKIDSERSFILAWKAVEKEGYKVVF
jgi:hypothetical protein